LLITRNSASVYRLAEPAAAAASAGRLRVSLVIASVCLLAGGALATRLLTTGPQPADMGSAVGQQARAEPAPAAGVDRDREGPPAPAALPSGAAAGVPQQPAPAVARKTTRPAPSPTPQVAARASSAAVEKKKVGPAGPPAASPATAATLAKALPYDPRNWWGNNFSEEQFRDLLRKVPEVSLEQAKEAPRSANEALSRLRDLVQSIRKQTEEDPDGFVTALAAARPDLAGLPFRKAKACTLDEGKTKTLAEVSVQVRCALAQASASLSQHTFTPAFPPVPAVFWSTLSGSRKTLEHETFLRTLQQVLLTERADMRVSLVEQLEVIKTKQASIALAERVLFDLEPIIREMALKALKERPHAEYDEVLLGGLRHPWGPAAGHAAVALVSLKVKDAVPRLVDLLDEPDPAAPFLQERNGKEVPVVRELVRVNHLRNCLLCHPPAPASTVAHRPRDSVRPAIPVPGAPLPAAQVYGHGSRDLFLRPEVTYLRQDFSVLQPVADPGRWPIWQRYDYLTRIRPLTAQEQAAWEGRKHQAGPEIPSLHRQAVLYALCGLTERNAGTTAADWRRLLGLTPAAAAARVWTSPCLK
jgi:hypothetical protein